MHRCFDLARLGEGRVSPNPMVGAVLVYQDRIIGEGFHAQYGGPHAEVQAVASVKKKDKSLISLSTLFVSLEPCCFHGKTPPCTSLILENRIPRVVISALDQSPEVNGRGVEILRAAGVEVITGLLQEEGMELAKPRTVYVSRDRPYVSLKMAISADGHFAPADRTRFWITNAFSKRLVHQFRAKTDAILIGTQTAISDNPELTNRLYFGKSPLRVVLDREGKIPFDHKVFTDQQPSLVYSKQPIPHLSAAISNVLLPFAGKDLKPLLKDLHERKVGTLLVEGGVALLQSFLEQDLWDEAWVFHGQAVLPNGIPAPLPPTPPARSFQLEGDRLHYHIRK